MLLRSSGEQAAADPLTFQVIWIQCLPMIWKALLTEGYPMEKSLAEEPVI